jgi:citrate lyase subunit beta-like protein
MFTGIVIPKVTSSEQVRFVDSMVQRHSPEDTKSKIKIIASIESALAIINLKEVSIKS